MIFVTVGTQIPFDRLLKSVEKQLELGNIKEKVLVQAGVTNFKSDKMEIVGFIPMDEFKKIIEEAKIIICHGGVGTITDVLRNKKLIIYSHRIERFNYTKK